VGKYSIWEAIGTTNSKINGMFADCQSWRLIGKVAGQGHRGNSQRNFPGRLVLTQGRARMDSPLNQDWLEEVAQRRLTAAEAARWRRELRRELVKRPAEARRLEEELALNSLLDSLPRPLASSNFTARILSEIQELPEQESGITRWWAWCVSRAQNGVGFWSGARFWSEKICRVWVQSIPIVVAVVCVAIPLNWGWQRVQTHRHGTMARTAAELSVAAAMPGVAVLQDFEAVQLLETRSAPDDVTLLQALREEAP
jgi:hypothetical protein